MPTLENVVMKRNGLNAALLLLSVLFLNACNAGKGATAAQVAVVDFHKKFEQEKFAQIYQESHQGFKDSVSEKKMIKLMATVKSKLGSIKSSKRAGFRFNTRNLKANIVLQYQTVYEHGKGVETFTYRLSGGEAFLMGWHINSNELIIAGAESEDNAKTEPATSPKSGKKPDWLK
ncbi:MAG: DUF4019 domain-containing protein [Verrucomicrobiales bacterium]|nr:DUF4019 domain-containing protein [Verrucomicrobiales bacterium]